jgi:hypothetical protein
VIESALREAMRKRHAIARADMPISMEVIRTVRGA